MGSSRTGVQSARNDEYASIASGIVGEDKRWRHPVHRDSPEGPAAARVDAPGARTWNPFASDYIRDLSTMPPGDVQEGLEISETELRAAASSLGDSEASGARAFDSEMLMAPVVAHQVQGRDELRGFPHPVRDEHRPVRGLDGLTRPGSIGCSDTPTSIVRPLAHAQLISVGLTAEQVLDLPCGTREAIFAAAGGRTQAASSSGSFSSSVLYPPSPTVSSLHSARRSEGVANEGRTRSAKRASRGEPGGCSPEEDGRENSGSHRQARLRRRHGTQPRADAAVDAASGSHQHSHSRHDLQTSRHRAESECSAYQDEADGDTCSRQPPLQRRRGPPVANGPTGENRSPVDEGVFINVVSHQSVSCGSASLDITNPLNTRTPAPRARPRRGRHAEHRGGHGAVAASPTTHDLDCEDAEDDAAGRAPASAASCVGDGEEYEEVQKGSRRLYMEAGGAVMEAADACSAHEGDRAQLATSEQQIGLHPFGNPSKRRRLRGKQPLVRATAYRVDQLQDALPVPAPAPADAAAPVVAGARAGGVQIGGMHGPAASTANSSMQRVSGGPSRCRSSTVELYRLRPGNRDGHDLTAHRGGSHMTWPSRSERPPGLLD